MQENFESALVHVLKHEGGYVNHPRDPGGATNKGVIQRTYNGYLRRKGRSLQSVRLITDEEVADIYKSQYWDAIHGDELPHGVDYCTFDAAVNSGPGRAAKWLQRAIVAKVDGAIGNETLGKVRTVAPDVIVNRMCDDRMSFLRRLRHWSTFGKGWTRRVRGVRSVSLEWTKRNTAPLEPVHPVTDPLPKPSIGGVAAAIAALVVAIGGALGISRPDFITSILEALK